MHTQLNKNELINVLFCPEGCHAMYAASKLDGYELSTAILCLAYQLRALDWHVMQKEHNGACWVRGGLLAWGSVHMQPAEMQTPPITCTVARLYQFNNLVVARSDDCDQDNMADYSRSFH